MDPKRRTIGSAALAAGLLLVAGSQAAGDGQVIWLDFDSASSPASPDHTYTTAQRDAIEAALADIFAPWGHSFTQTEPITGPTTKVEFNDGGFGTSTAVDFRNLITDIDLAAVDAGFALDSTGKPRTSANIVQASVNLAAHELGHLFGARHHDAYNPIGAGAGGAGASSTYQSLTTVLGIDGDRIISPDLYVSPRTAFKLEFADAGAVIPEGPEPNDALTSAAPIALSEFFVPNTLPATDPTAGLPLLAAAVSVEGALEEGVDLVDNFVFDAKAGQVVTIEVMSDVLDHRLDEFDAKIELLDIFGTPLTGGFVTGSIDGPDPTLVDFLIPADGEYVIKVTSEIPFAGVAEYELLVYSVEVVPAPGALWALTPLALTAAMRRRRAPASRPSSPRASIQAA